MNQRKITLFLLIYLSMLNINSAYSTDKMWKWIDDKKVIHYTDDRLKVPHKYRDGAESISKSSPAFQGNIIESPPPIPQLLSRKEEVNEGANENISILRELMNHIENEVKRDKKIISWTDNIIAFRQTRELLGRDLPEKIKLFELIKKKGAETENIIGYITKNIKLEESIRNSLAGVVNEGRMFVFKNSKRQIQQALPEKEKLIKSLKTAISMIR